MTAIYMGLHVAKSRGLALFFLALLFVALAACGGQDELPRLEQRAISLNKTIMCPVCPGESIDQSQNQLAVQMRGIVREKLAEGWSDDEIKQFFVERYGPSVILEPPREGFSLAAWIVPPVALAVAVAALLLVLRVMRRAPSAQPEGPAAAVRLTSDERDYYFRRIEAALEIGEEEKEPS
ncbi:MAG: cytochrome c-type biogenesis protein CcmH [Chloroflexi bacterium]|nr:cytochrome c-type biogenesis protein CcmH [Chloroflexota bacterium]